MKREYYKTIIKEPAKTWLDNNQCPSCGKPKPEWARRTDWRCCSVECTARFEDYLIIRSWQDLRWKAFERDKFTCEICKVQHDDGSLLEGDHIIAIAIGGDEWDLNNVQTLCKGCHKVKTKDDRRIIARYKKLKKENKIGQKTLGEKFNEIRKVFN